MWFGSVFALTRGEWYYRVEHLLLTGTTSQEREEGMNYLAKIFSVALLTIAVGTFSGCKCNKDEKGKGAGKGPESKTELTITINSWIGWAPLYLAVEKGLLKKTNLKITRVEDTASRKSTMIAGHVDGYASSVDNFALDSAQGVPGKQVLAFDESAGGDGIVAQKSVAKLADLKGKQVAFQKGLPSHFLLLTVLKEAGLSSADIKQVDMDADKAGAAFTSGKLDAAVTWEPWISKSAEMADGKILVTTKDYPGLVVDTLVFRDQVIKEKREAVQDVVKGWFDALAYWEKNKDEADNLMAKAYSLPVDDFRAMCSGVRFYDLAKNKEYFGTEAAPGPIFKVFNSAAELWKAEGIIKTPKKPADAIDASFILAL